MPVNSGGLVKCTMSKTIFCFICYTPALPCLPENLGYGSDKRGKVLWVLKYPLPQRHKIRGDYLYMRVIDQHVCCCFLHPAHAQSMDSFRSNYTCIHFLSCDTPVHRWNKQSLDIKRDMKERIGWTWNHQWKHYWWMNAWRMGNTVSRALLTGYNHQV